MIRNQESGVRSQGSGVRRAAFTREAFTLLEMILAMSIGLVILIALYGLLWTQTREAHTGRETLEDGTLARALLTRIANDILGELGPVDPRVLPDPTAAASTTPATDTSGTDTSGTSGTTASATTPSTTTTDMTTVTDGAVVLNRGITGTSNTLVLTLTKVPRELNLNGALGAVDTQSQLGVSDLRRIAYWVVAGTDQNAGLCRQETLGVTSADIDTTPPDGISDPASYVVAPEVKSISFQYWNGSSWDDAWDGSYPDETTTLPVGPPAAIKITLVLVRRSQLNGELTERELSFEHVVNIPTGNNYPQP